MSWEDEFTDIEKAESQGGKYITKPCVEKVEITKCDLSEDIVKDYKGKPYLEVTFKTENDLTNSSRFYRTHQEYTDEVNGYKKKAIKELFENSGIDLKGSGLKALKEIIGKSIKVLFKAEEFIAYDSDNNNKPYISQSIKYSYSGPADQPLEGQQKYFHKPLKPKELARFQLESGNWERDNGGVDSESLLPPSESGPGSTKESNPKDEDSDDLPF